MFPPCWLMWRVKTVGKDNLPQTTPYIVAPVHRSYIDTLLAAYITNRRLRFMAKEEIFSRAWSARLFGSLGGFPVRRGTPDREALQMCQRALAGGEPVVLFPEGTRRSGAEVQPLFDGPGLRGLEGQRAHRARGHRRQRTFHAGGGEVGQAGPHRHGDR